MEHIDRRIEVSCKAWRDWTEGLGYGGTLPRAGERSALALKLLLYSPTGAIAAAATTSLPEGIGGRKNYDYRYAWVRDAGYVIKAFLRLGAHAESSAALTWLVRRLDEHGAQVLYTLNGETVSDEEELDLPGYRNSRPVRRGNAATGSTSTVSTATSSRRPSASSSAAACSTCAPAPCLHA